MSGFPLLLATLPIHLPILNLYLTNTHTHHLHRYSRLLIEPYKNYKTYWPEEFCSISYIGIADNQLNYKKNDKTYWLLIHRNSLTWLSFNHRLNLQFTCWVFPIQYSTYLYIWPAGGMQTPFFFFSILRYASTQRRRHLQAWPASTDTL